MKTKFEHANLHVTDVGRMLVFLQSAFPDFVIRKDSGEDDPERWVHVGHEDVYLSVYQSTAPLNSQKIPYDGAPGFNHLGFVVDDLEALRQRLINQGFKETTIPNDHPARRRIYFNDAEGNDWEFVQYFSDKPGERNDYLLD